MSFVNGGRRVISWIIAHSFLGRVKQLRLRLNTLAAEINDIKATVDETKADLEALSKSVTAGMAILLQQRTFAQSLGHLRERIPDDNSGSWKPLIANEISNLLSQQLRGIVRAGAGLPEQVSETDVTADLLREIEFIKLNRVFLKPLMQALAAKRVLYVGQAYYNAWYLSRGLRKLGWVADVLNWDTNPASQIYYHGEDVRFDGQAENELEMNLQFYVASLYAYDVFHFSNPHGISFGWPVQDFFSQHFRESDEIHLLKDLGKKIVYSNNGCLDGVSQTSFSKWGPESVCAICVWRDRPDVCSDARNLAWGKFRNSVADYQCLLGGNRADYNISPSIHEAPEFYCLDPELWSPNIEIPSTRRLTENPGVIRLYHAVGNHADRTTENGVNVKSSHVYLPLIEKLRAEGFNIELLSPTNVPNKEVRFIQAQADIFLEMLTYGWYGANAREAMMLGKPVICYIRPSWLEDVRREIPEYAEELPIISATPDTVEGILRDLIANPQKRNEIGECSRAFAIKWHSADTGARKFDGIYTRLLSGDPVLLSPEQMAHFHG